MIEIQNLLFRYDDKAFGFRIGNLSVDSVSRVAFVGPSGCGKSTLLNLMAGVLLPRGGSLHVQGTEVSRLSDAERRAFRLRSVGMVFQEFELLDYLNVQQNILLPFSLGMASSTRSELHESLDGLAVSLGIASLLDRRIDRLSQGERQRVAICRALMAQPSLILADEPTGNVDPRQSREILELLFEHVGQYGSTLVMATHDHGLLDQFDNVIDFSRPEESGIELFAEVDQ